VAEVARRLGKPLMPHQRHIVDVAFEIDPATGYLAYSEVVVIGPRQVTGKTELILPVMTHRCVGFDEALTGWVRDQLGIVLRPPGPQEVLYTAQTADDARKKWRKVHLERLKASSYYRPRRQFDFRVQRNMEAILWENGSAWSPGSTTGKTAGTGDSLDLGVIDEAWSRPDSRTELGMRPAKMTRPWSQLLIASMIPGLSRALPGTWPYLRRKREIGRARIEAGVRRGSALFDFTAAGNAETTDPGDPATWYSCMPGLGRTVTEKTVAEDFDEFDLVDFCAEYLGWEPTVASPKWTVIRYDTWEGLRDPASFIAGTPAMSIEMTEDRQRAFVCSAGKRLDEDWHVEVVEPGHGVAADVVGIDWVLRCALALDKARKPYTWVIDPRSPAAAFIVPLKNAGVDVLTPNGLEIAGACGRFYDATGEKRESEVPYLVDDDQTPRGDDGVRVRHLGQIELERALASAKKLDHGSGGAFTFVKKGTVDALRPLYGVVLAMHGVEVKGSVVPEPDIF